MAEPGHASNLISCAAVFIVSDIQSSVAFYRDQLGFKIDQIWGEPPSFAIAESPNASIMLKQGNDPARPAKPAPNTDRVGGVWDVYVWVRNLDQICADLNDRGTQYSGPDAQPYDCTEIVVTDPDGYLICFGFCP